MFESSPDGARGRIVTVRGERIMSDGLAAAGQGAVVQIEGVGRGVVTALRAERVELRCVDAGAPAISARVELSSAAPITEGARLDPLGRALDSGRPAPLPAGDPRFTLRAGLPAVDLMIDTRPGEHSAVQAGTSRRARTVLEVIARQQHLDGVRLVHLGPPGRALSPSAVSVVAPERPAMAMVAAARTATALADLHAARGETVVLAVEAPERVRRAHLRVWRHLHPISPIARMLDRPPRPIPITVLLVAPTAAPFLDLNLDRVWRLHDVRAPHALLRRLERVRPGGPQRVAGVRTAGGVLRSGLRRVLEVALSARVHLEDESAVGDATRDYLAGSRLLAWLRRAGLRHIEPAEQVIVCFAALYARDLPPARFPHRVLEFVERVRTLAPTLTQRLQTERRLREADAGLLAQLGALLG